MNVSPEKECILIDENDQEIGPISKQECHMHHGLLHRAFSVFIFNQADELLVQKRSLNKVTFPHYWANTCCGHPVFAKEERESREYLGVKRAAIRRLNEELGIPINQFLIDDLNFMTRLHYHSPYGKDYSEHEIDYLLLIKGVDKSQLSIEMNDKEVIDYQWLSFNECHEFIYDKNIKVAPWFLKIYERFLPIWWENLHQLSDYQDDKIHGDIE